MGMRAIYNPSYSYMEGAFLYRSKVRPDEFRDHHYGLLCVILGMMSLEAFINGEIENRIKDENIKNDLLGRRSSIRFKWGKGDYSSGIERIGQAKGVSSETVLIDFWNEDKDHIKKYDLLINARNAFVHSKQFHIDFHQRTDGSHNAEYSLSAIEDFVNDFERVVGPYEGDPKWPAIAHQRKACDLVCNTIFRMLMDYVEVMKVNWREYESIRHLLEKNGHEVA